MVYLDNAATTLSKPACVVNAVVEALGSLGNAGRGATEGSLGAARAVHGCRAKVARLLGCPRADHVCFVANSTAALNTAIRGLVHPGDRVVSSVLEHNSVLRPLNRLAVEAGVEVAHVGCDELGRLDYGDMARLLLDGARAVVVTHASNVTGNAVDIARVAAMAHDAGALCIVDASQSAGCLPIDMDAMGLDVVCFTGHKGLLGPQGTGGLAVMPGVEVEPLVMGGSGVHSFDALQPREWPTRLEAGTLNGHGLAGLSAGLDYIEERGGAASMGAREYVLARRLYRGVRDIPGVRVYGDWAAGDAGACGAGAVPGGPGANAATADAVPACAPRAAIVALNVRDMDSSTVSDALAQGWGIATRPGAHCAPLMHRALGTEGQGIVRFSVGWDTTKADIDIAIQAVAELAG